MSDRGVVAGLAAPLILAASATSLALPPSRSVSPRTNTDPAPAWTLHPFHRLVVASSAQPRVAKARSAVVARAEVDRRALLAGAAALSAAVAAPAANAVDLIDDRGARAKGFDIIYEARDLDLPQAQRDGLSRPAETPRSPRSAFPSLLPASTESLGRISRRSTGLRPARSFVARSEP